MVPADSDISAEVGRVIAALRTAIRLGRISHRQIERELHMSRGYLTRILAGQVQLRVNHVLGVCRVIGLPPGSFFTALFPAGPAAPPHDPVRLIQEFRDSLDQLKALLEKLKEPHE
jgi:transcriptional regulator with XRE-family HTH domain